MHFHLHLTLTNAFFLTNGRLFGGQVLLHRNMSTVPRFHIKSMGEVWFLLIGHFIIISSYLLYVHQSQVSWGKKCISEGLLSHLASEAPDSNTLIYPQHTHYPLPQRQIQGAMPGWTIHCLEVERGTEEPRR